jgi:choice-of-anchor C domain-containing protein
MHPAPHPRALYVALCVVASAALAATPSLGELIVNGSLESGPDPGVAIELPVGSTAIAGWVVTRNPVDYCGTRWNAPDGARSIALNGTSPGGVAQTFTTSPGAQYTVKFCMAGDAVEPFQKHMRVGAGGQTQDYQFDSSHSWPWGMGWLQQTFAFTANAASTTLEFRSLDAGSTGPALDSVVVSGPVVGVPSAGSTSIALAPPFPNPARHGFEVVFSLASEAPVRLSVCDVQGREVRVLAAGTLGPGRHARAWDGATARGRAPAGLYLVRLATPGLTLVRKAILAR